MSKSSDIKLAVFEEKLDNMHLLQKEILEQVKYTNGRVKKLERWRTFVTAFLVGASIVMVYKNPLDAIVAMLAFV